MLERIARGEDRALLSLATGAGKTYIAVHLLRRLADAGLLRRALFLVDRDELRNQALGTLQNVFGADAAAVSGGNPQMNARVLVATYQTLGIDRSNRAAGAAEPATDAPGAGGLALEVADAGAPTTFLEQHYPPDYFNLVIIDECHRSGWGEWSAVLTRNAGAIQVGLTATPRQLTGAVGMPGAGEDAAITADNLRYFGDPVYEYELGQGIEDGYLAACEIVRRDVFLEGSPFAERETGVDRDDLAPLPLWDTITGAQVAAAETREHYGAQSFEDRLVMPDRVQAMADDFFDQLVATGGPEQKTIVYCARDSHADDVAIALNNRYARWCAENGHRLADPYAFTCTAAVQGPDPLPELRGAARHHFVATTVELLTTGVDVPSVRNIVFFRYVRSPIAFYQMIGRGTRLDPPSGKLMFRVFDYTAATRLFGEAFRTRATTERTEPTEPTGEPAERRITVQGIDVRVSDAGKAILTTVDGVTVPIGREEYQERLAERLLAQAPSLDAFRATWILPPERADLLAALPDGGRSAGVIRSLEGMDDFDLYDVLAELGCGLDPKTRVARADAFDYKHAGWLADLPPATSATLCALAAQFALGGTDELEEPGVLQLPAVVAAGGLAALNALGSPAEILRETKSRLFAA